jgi:hypothetical protein
MMCCKVIAIPEMPKEAGVWCPHAVPGKGCGIYENRPQGCRTFYCHWMIDPSLGPEWKPDRAKFVLHAGTERIGGQLIILAVDPNFPNAWTKAPYFEMIKRWANDGAAEGRLVLVHIGSRHIAVLPDRIVEIGKVDAEFTWALVPKLEAGGVNYGVIVNGRLF